MKMGTRTAGSGTVLTLTLSTAVEREQALPHGYFQENDGFRAVVLKIRTHCFVLIKSAYAYSAISGRQL